LDTSRLWIDYRQSTLESIGSKSSQSSKRKEKKNGWKKTGGKMRYIVMKVSLIKEMR
jgi:hypothetical protein